ncbi:MAG: AAA family ATPase [Evtepia gabavorous]
MKLLQLTATFGCLQGDTLEFGPGMTLIGAPNGSGKSTWCAFLRTMLYGLDTRQRDRKGAPADKNRYRPWSGSPMEGCWSVNSRAGSWSSAGPPPAGCPWGIFPRSTRTPAWPCPA